MFVFFFFVIYFFATPVLIGNMVKKSKNLPLVFLVDGGESEITRWNPDAGFWKNISRPDWRGVSGRRLRRYAQVLAQHTLSSGELMLGTHNNGSWAQVTAFKVFTGKGREKNGKKKGQERRKKKGGRFGPRLVS